MSSATEVHEPEVKKPVEERPKSQVSASLQTAELGLCFQTVCWSQAGLSTAASLSQRYFHLFFNVCWWESQFSCR
jgi:hypothetical protein